MYHPTSRVLTVLELLQSRSLISGPDLAMRLEVNVRTVRHYVTVLQDIGIPVEAIIGRHGGYRLRPGFKLPPLMFTNEEVLALILGLMVVQKVGVDAMVPAVEGATAKIGRVLPVHLRRQVQALQETLSVGIPSPEVLVEQTVLEAISLATQQAHQVRFLYHNEVGMATERTIDPYGVAYHSGKWYTVGYCHLRSHVRIFRLDRVQQIEMQEQTFTRPRDFQILEHLFQSFVAIPDNWNVEVLLHMSLEEALRKIPPGLATLTFEPQAQGILFAASIDNLTWMAHFLVGLGCSFQIRQPLELKTALKELVVELMNLVE